MHLQVTLAARALEHIMAHAVVAVLMLALACANAQTYTLDTQQPQKVCPEAGLPS